MFLDDTHAGYLSREDARTFRHRLEACGLGTAPTLAAAKVVTGLAKRGGRGTFGVLIDIEALDEHDLAGPG